MIQLAEPFQQRKSSVQLRIYHTESPSAGQTLDSPEESLR